MSDSRINTSAARIVPAPPASDPRARSTILDVLCGLNEEVEWHLTMTDRGWFVSGYSIIRRPGKLKGPCPSTESAGVTPRRKMQPRRRGIARR